jgi:hypothetical protein
VLAKATNSDLGIYNNNVGRQVCFKRMRPSELIRGACVGEAGLPATAVSYKKLGRVAKLRGLATKRERSLRGAKGQSPERNNNHL